MSERLLVSTLYAGLLLLSLWAGGKAIGWFQDYRAYSTFLAPWGRALRAFEDGGGAWPEFTGANHAPYMQELAARLRGRTGFKAPGPGRGAFMYALEKPGAERQDLFLLARPGVIVVYGLSGSSARRLDKLIDGRQDLASGAFQAAPGAGNSWTARWRL